MMKKVRFYGLFTLLVIGIALGLGCPQGGADRPATYPVTGTVTHNGELAGGATVTFVATGAGHSASGVTDASGKYSLTTFTSADGAVPGQYGVKILKYEGGAADAAGGAGGEPLEPGGLPEGVAEAGADGEEEGDGSEFKNLLPEKYADPGTSGFSKTVAEGDNTFDFALED